MITEVAALNYIANDVRIVSRAAGHFKEAMKVGYVTSPQKGTIIELPGSKVIEYRHGEWRVLDTYFVGSDGVASGGITMMWYGPVPIWMMQYIGRYEKQAIPCLKAALSSIYLAGHFNGGRGPNCIAIDGYVYINSVEQPNFPNVMGIEKIFDTVTGKEVGFHRYQAQWLAGRRT